MRRIATLISAAAATLSPSAPGAAPADPVREAAAHAIAALGLQQTLPHGALPVEPSGWRWNLPIPEEALWAIAVVVVGALVYYIWQELQGARRSRDDAWRTGAPNFAEARRNAASSLAAADALAGEGRFVEAMHLLLLHSLTELRRGLGVELADSLTSREILRKARLPERGRAALDRIVARVELTWFGDRPASRADYDSCRVGFEELSGVLAGAQPT